MRLHPNTIVVCYCAGKKRNFMSQTNSNYATLVYSSSIQPITRIIRRNGLSRGRFENEAVSRTFNLIGYKQAIASCLIMAYRDYILFCPKK